MSDEDEGGGRCEDEGVVWYKDLSIHPSIYIRCAG